MAVTETPGVASLIQYFDHTIEVGTEIIPSQLTGKMKRKKRRRIFGSRRFFPARVTLKTNDHVTYSSTPMTVTQIEVVE